MKKTIILFAALIALAMASCSNDTPDQVVDKFYRATQVYVHLVTANITSDSSENEINIPCVKEGRKWKVAFF